MRTRHALFAHSVLLVILNFGVTTGAPAQSVRGSISGIVKDSTGSVVPGAKVTLIDKQTSRTRSTATDANGEFRFALVPPGSYSVELKHPGFRTTRHSVVVQVNQEVRTELPLEVGEVVDWVPVTTAPPFLRSDSAALGAVISNRQVVGLPLDGRNFFELALLLPGTVPPAPGSAGSVRGEFAMNINGGREGANQFLLDGVYDGDPELNGVGVNPPVDAILEFEVLTANYDAAFGRNAGGQVNVALKSGSNAFHGTAYEFLRNAALDARNHFASRSEPKPKYQRHQFGFSVGGPIVRDRTFFFTDYEGRIVREGITHITNVPTAAERSGDFSQSPGPPPVDPSSGTPFPGGVLPFMHPIGSAIANLYPQPNRNVAGANFVSSPTLRDAEHHFDIRVDHAFTPSSELTFRYSFADRELFEPFAGPTFALVPGFGNDVPRRAQNLMLAETHVFSSTLLNELRFAFNRIAGGAFQENEGTSLNRQVGLPELSSNPRDFGLSFIRITGFSPLGHEFNSPQHSVTNTFQALDHVAWARGRHLGRFGFDVRATQQNAFRHVQSRGFLNFLGVFTGNSLADLLLGLPTLTGGATLDNPQHLRTESYAWFVHDQWRMHPRVSLTAGLRYELISPPVDTDDRANVFDPATGQLVPVGTSGIPRSGYAADTNNFGPRLGLAWMLDGSQETVLRAGYGIYFDQSQIAPGEGLYFNPPFFDFRLFFSLPPQPPFFPGFTLTLDDPFLASFPLQLPRSAFTFQRDLAVPYVQHWSVSVQRKLGTRRMAELAYAGSKGTRLLTARDINQPSPSPVIPNPRPNLAFDDITRVESRSNSTYHALQACFQQNYDFGLTLLAGYTWSKSIDDASSFFSSAGDANFPQDSNNVRAERGLSNFDTRQRFTVAYSYDVPLGNPAGAVYIDPVSWWERFVDAAVSGWQAHGVITLQSGRPFTVALLPELDQSNTGRSILGFGANDRPNRVGQPRLANPTETLWFNTAAFQLQPFGSFGTAGRNILEGSGLAAWNFSLVKNTPLRRETMNLQFRAEFFNLFNRTNYDLPDIFLGSPTFGQITSAGPPRRTQFGVKLLW